jgi:G patch domain-containing protein 1
LDPKARAALLGEEQLPGKSVFDFLTPAARDRLVSASGKSNLPVARGESLYQGTGMPEAIRQKQLWDLVPRLDKDIALKALGRGVGGWMPYAEDEAKRTRYRGFLEGRAGLRDGLPERALGTTKADWAKELREFAHAAEIFKPMTGLMASRFTTSAALPKAASDGPDPAGSTSASLLTHASKRLDDPAEEAARLGMYGPLTRSTHQFFPTRLLCKRFNVKPPPHVQADANRPSQHTDVDDGTPTGADRFRSGGYQTPSSVPANKTSELISKSAMNEMLHESAAQRAARGLQTGDIAVEASPQGPAEVLVDAERNLTLEAERPGEAVFKAIFGSDDDDDDDEG